MTPSVGDVYTTPELLGDILSYLSMHDLFRVKTASKHIKAVIETNPECKQAMFLDPVAGEPYAAFAPVDDVDHLGQPLHLLNQPRPEVAGAITSLQLGGISTSENMFAPAKLHQIGATPLYIHARKGSSKDRNKAGSWRALLLSTKGDRINIGVWVLKETRKNPSYKLRRIRATTMGELVDKLEYLVLGAA